MISTTPPVQPAPPTPTFGFAPQTRVADWRQFPAWYRARCLLTPVPRDVPATEPGAIRAAA